MSKIVSDALVKKLAKEVIDSLSFDKTREKKPVEEGGAGSGNFGHAGRPGVRGGSAPEGGGDFQEPSYADLVKADLDLLGTGTKGTEENPVNPDEIGTYFHGTTVRVLKSVAKQGLIPSERLYGVQYYTGDRKDAVFLTSDKDDAAAWGDAAAGMKGRGTSGTVIVFEIRLPKGSLKSDTHAGGGRYYHPGKISPEYIKGFWVLPASGEYTSNRFKYAGHGKLRERKEEEEVFYVPVIIFRKKKEESKGSGNFGHVGRPGHRGGSARRILETTTTKEIAGFPGLLAKIRRVKNVLHKKFLTSWPK